MQICFHNRLPLKEKKVDAQGDCKNTRDGYHVDQRAIEVLPRGKMTFSFTEGSG